MNFGNWVTCKNNFIKLKFVYIGHRPNALKPSFLAFYKHIHIKTL